MKYLEVVKMIGYLLLLMLVFSPLTFLVANTFTEKTEDMCYDKYPYLSTDKVTAQDQKAQNDARVTCEESYQVTIAKEQTTIFIIVSILSIITLVALLVMTNIKPIISYSLFFGVGINMIRLVWGFDEANSFVAAGLGIILFVTALIFINKTLSKSKKEKINVTKKKSKEKIKK